MDGTTRQGRTGGEREGAKGNKERQDGRHDALRTTGNTKSDGKGARGRQGDQEHQDGWKTSARAPRAIRNTKTALRLSGTPRQTEDKRKGLGHQDGRQDERKGTKDVQECHIGRARRVTDSKINAVGAKNDQGRR